MYTFIVWLCNYFDKCNYASKQLSTLNVAMPTVTIPGNSLRVMQSSDTLVLSAIANLQSCGAGTNSIEDLSLLSYSWTVYEGTKININLNSLSQTPSRFVLPVRSLVGNTYYTVKVLVSRDNNGTSAQAATQLYVPPGSIVPIVRGGFGNRKMQIGGKLVLDGSLSYDENVRNKFGTSAGLQYEWSCIQVSPTFELNCANVFNQTILIQNRNNEILSLESLSINKYYTCEVTIRVSDALRYASQIIKVTTLPLLTPVINLHDLSYTVIQQIYNNSVIVDGIINPDSTLQLLATISLPAILQGNATWKLAPNSNDIDLSSVSLTGLQLPISHIPEMQDESIIQSFNTYLVIAANSLTPGGRYTFLMDCQVVAPGINSQNSI